MREEIDMLYDNNTEAAVLAMERARTGNYGEDAYPDYEECEENEENEYSEQFY